MFAPPAVAGDLVYIGSCSGTFFALDIRTGDPRWTYDVRKDGKQTSFHGAILVEKNAVLFGTDMSCATDAIGHVYAAHPQDGRILWKWRSRTGVSTNLLRTRASVCFGTTFGEWGCLDPRTGALRWKTSPARTTCELPTWADTDGERLFVVMPDGALAALRSSNGAVIWKRSLGGRATTSPIVVKGVVHVGASDNRMYSLKAANGDVLHSVAVDGRPAGRPAMTKDGLLFFIERPSAPKGALVALDAKGAKLRWSRDHARGFASEEPHVWRDEIVTGDCSGAIHAFALADGSPRWQMNVAGCIRSISSAGDALFFGAQEGMVYAAGAE